MNKYERLPEITERLRQSRRTLTAEQLAESLEVSVRTIYRDISVLRSRGVPIDGEAGVGYRLDYRYQLPRQNFTQQEIDALTVGLALVARTGDVALGEAAQRCLVKLTNAVPTAARSQMFSEALQVSRWHDMPTSGISAARLRAAIHKAEILELEYHDASRRQSLRQVYPVALIYYTDAVVLAGWCLLRRGFRHFRSDRISACRSEGEFGKYQQNVLLQAWQSSRRAER